MTTHDDELAELTAALDVTPPASFAVGVRARVARSRARTRQMWWGLAAAASVTLAAVVMWRPAAPATEVATAALATPAVPAADVQRAVEPDTAVRVASASPTVNRVASPVAKSTLERRAATSAEAAEPQLVVITNQPEVLRAQWADFDWKNLSLVQVEAAVASAPGLTAPIAVAPIAVAPIVVAPIVVGDLGTVGGRAGATPAIRRVDAAWETK